MQFTFDGAQELCYPNLRDAAGGVLVAKPGETYDLPEAPDARWRATRDTKAPPVDTDVATKRPAEPTAPAEAPGTAQESDPATPSADPVE